MTVLATDHDSFVPAYGGMSSEELAKNDKYDPSHEKYLCLLLWERALIVANAIFVLAYPASLLCHRSISCVLMGCLYLQVERPESIWVASLCDC